MGLRGAPGHLGGIRRGLEAHPEVQVRNGGLGGFGRPTLRCGRAQEAYPEVWEGSGGPPGGPRGVGRPIRRSNRDWVGLGGAPGHLGGIRRGLEAHPEVQVRNGSLGGFGRLTQRSGRGRDTHPDIRKGSGGPPGAPGGVGRPTQSSDKGWVGLRGAPGHLGEIRRGLEAHPEV